MHSSVPTEDNSMRATECTALLAENDINGKNSIDTPVNINLSILTPNKQSHSQLHSQSNESTTDSPTLKEHYVNALGYIPLRFQTKQTSSNLSTLPLHNPTLTPVLRQSLDRDLTASTLDSNEKSVTVKSIGDYFLPGSIKASIFNLCSATLGAGALALPYAFARCGIVIGLILLFIACIASIYSIQLLIACRDKTLLSSYEDLSVHCFGNKMAIFVELNIVLFCFGTCVAYIVAVGDIVQPVAAILFPDTLFSNKAILMTLFVLIFMLPLSLVSKINELRFSSLLGVLSIVFLVFVVVFRSSQHIYTNGTSEVVKYSTDSFDDIFIAIPILMFAFTCQVNVFSIYTELQRPSIRRMNKVVNRSFAINSSIYILIGLFGYLHYLSSTDSDILKNLDLSDPLIACAQFGVGLTVVLAYPLNIYPARFTLEMLFFDTKIQSNLRFLGITLVLVMGSLLIAIVTPNINCVFSLLGSTTSSIVCFILPGAFYISVMDGSKVDSSKFGAWSLAIGGAIVGIIATAVSIKNISENTGK